MKRTIAATALLCATYVSAHGAILMGKIAGKDGQSIDAMRVTLTSGSQTTVAWLKSSGTYYTDDIPEGTYEVVVSCTNKTYTGSVKVNGAGEHSSKRFCNLTLSDGKVEASFTGDDPFMAAELERVKQSQLRIDVPSQTQSADGNIVPQQTHFYAPATEKPVKQEPVYYDKVKLRKR